jgi:hypothetical protein
MCMIVTRFCKTMNHSTILVLIATIALCTSVIMGGIFIVTNHAHAYSFCKAIDNKTPSVCMTSSDVVCTNDGSNLFCTTRDTH